MLPKSVHPFRLGRADTDVTGISSVAAHRAAASTLVGRTAVLQLIVVAGISEVSRFSCMKFLGVPGVFDYAGLNRDSRYRPCSCCLPHIYTASASGL